MSAAPINDGGQAFPGPNDATQNGSPLYPEYGGGMTLRDYFAAKAMAALITCAPNHGDLPQGMAAIDAYRYADAMLKARSALAKTKAQLTAALTPAPKPKTARPGALLTPLTVASI